MDDPRGPRNCGVIGECRSTRKSSFESSSPMTQRFSLGLDFDPRRGKPRELIAKINRMQVQFDRTAPRANRAQSNPPAQTEQLTFTLFYYKYSTKT